MKITKTINKNTTIYFYDGIKKYEYYKDSSDGHEYWLEYKNGKEVHYKNIDGFEWWKEYKNDKEFYYKNNKGNEWWSDDNPNHPKNREIAEEDVKPFVFRKK